MTPVIIQLTVGVIVLFLGSEFLVRGSVSLAKAFRMPGVWIGLTVVAYGTSAPELFVSTQAAMTASPDIALGNVIGSVICNILLVLGAVALIQPLATDTYRVRRDALAMIAASALLILFCLDGSLDRSEGLLLIAALAVYTWLCRRTAGERPVGESGDDCKTERGWCAAGYILVGGGLLMTGADILINGALSAAVRFGLSEAVAGLTVVAIVTSLPELAASIAAARHKQAKFCLSNLIGGCIFNILGIAGLCAAVNPIPVAAAFIGLHLWVMLSASLLCLAALYSKKTLSRAEGAVFLALYAGYIVYQYA